MAMGLAEVPSETLRPLHMSARSSRQQSKESLPTIVKDGESSLTGETSAPPASPKQNQPSFHAQESLTRVQAPLNLSRFSSPASTIDSGSISGTEQGQLSSVSDDSSRSRVRSRSEFTVSKNHDMLRQKGVHTSKGFGRFAKAAFQAPMEISVGLTKGFHNFPKLWGDDTVRPQEKVTDFKSGALAAGKEFGYGWYDGVTGLVTQPWKGAQKEGVSGFAKGVGKGLGGFVTKPFAALAGILGHTMKGVHKEIQKLFGSNVQNYIVASRVAQGYEEWLLSSDAEKEDVIVRWKLIEKYPKSKSNLDGMVKHVIDSQQRENMENIKAPRNGEYIGQFANADATQNPGNVSNGFPSTGELRTESRISDDIRMPVQETPHGNAEEANVKREAQERLSQFQHQQQEAADYQAEQENVRQTVAPSEIETQRHASEILEFEKQLRRVMAQSQREQRHRNSSYGLGFEMDHAEEDEDEPKQTIKSL